METSGPATRPRTLRGRYAALLVDQGGAAARAAAADSAVVRGARSACSPCSGLGLAAGVVPAGQPRAARDRRRDARDRLGAARSRCPTGGRCWPGGCPTSMLFLGVIDAGPTEPWPWNPVQIVGFLFVLVAARAHPGVGGHRLGHLAQPRARLRVRRRANAWGAAVLLVAIAALGDIVSRRRRTRLAAGRAGGAHRAGAGPAGGAGGARPDRPGDARRGGAPHVDDRGAGGDRPLPGARPAGQRPAPNWPPSPARPAPR